MIHFAPSIVFANECEIRWDLTKQREGILKHVCTYASQQAGENLAERKREQVGAR